MRGGRPAVPDAARVDRIARLEKIKAAAAALQMAESVRFAQSQAERAAGRDVHRDKIGRGIADQLGLACHSPGSKLPSARGRSGVVVRSAGNLSAAGRRRDQRVCRLAGGDRNPASGRQDQT